MKKKIYRAGVIPFIVENEKIQMLFMLPAKSSHGGKSYQIAKGKQEHTEDIKDTAFREAKEELGLFEGNIKETANIGEWLGRTTVYIAHIEKKEMFGDPHHETKSTKWLTLKEFIDIGRSLHIPIVKAAHRKMKKLLKV